MMLASVLIIAIRPAHSSTKRMRHTAARHSILTTVIGAYRVRDIAGWRKWTNNIGGSSQDIVYEKHVDGVLVKCQFARIWEPNAANHANMQQLQGAVTELIKREPKDLAQNGFLQLKLNRGACYGNPAFLVEYSDSWRANGWTTPWVDYTRKLSVCSKYGFYVFSLTAGSVRKKAQLPLIVSQEWPVVVSAVRPTR
jgi:hypothetical protein